MKKGLWIALVVAGGVLVIFVALGLIGLMFFMQVKRSETVAVIEREQALRSREAMEEERFLVEAERLELESVTQTMRADEALEQAELFRDENAQLRQDLEEEAQRTAAAEAEAQRLRETVRQLEGRIHQLQNP